MRNEEGVFIGYCFHGEVWALPYLPVWHLLSNTFALSDLAVKVADKCVTVTGGVAGTGSRTDWEIMQIHVAPALAPRPRPAREMMDPAKVRLAPGESWRLQVLLPERAFAEFGTERRAWVTEAMIHEIEVGR